MTDEFRARILVPDAVEIRATLLHTRDAMAVRARQLLLVLEKLLTAGDRSGMLKSELAIGIKFASRRRTVQGSNSDVGETMTERGKDTRRHCEDVA